MLLAGIFGPDSLGPEHGHILAQRLVLLGLAAIMPAIDIPLATRWGRMAAGCLVVALGLQTVIVWDYAYHCKGRRCSSSAQGILSAAARGLPLC